MIYYRIYGFKNKKQYGEHIATVNSLNKAHNKFNEFIIYDSFERLILRKEEISKSHIRVSTVIAQLEK